MVTAPHTPVPFAAGLEDLYVPNAASIAAAVRSVLEYAGGQRRERGDDHRRSRCRNGAWR